MVVNLRVISSVKLPWFKQINQTECIGHYCDILKYLARSANFSFSFVNFSGEFGRESKGNQWNGTIGQFQRNVILFIAFLNTDNNFFRKLIFIFILIYAQRDLSRRIFQTTLYHIMKII